MGKVEVCRAGDGWQGAGGGGPLPLEALALEQLGEGESVRQEDISKE